MTTTRTTLAGLVLVVAAIAVAGPAAATASASGPVLADHDATTENSSATDGTNATLAPVGGDVPEDLDGDGRHEDLNANGETDLADVVTFFQHREAPAITGHADAYDFNGNGEIELADAVELFGIATDDSDDDETETPTDEPETPTDAPTDGPVEVSLGEGQLALREHPEDDSVDLWAAVDQRVAVDASGAEPDEDVVDPYTVYSGAGTKVHDPVTGFRYDEPGTYTVEVGAAEWHTRTVRIVPRDRLERNGTRRPLPGNGTAADPYELADVDDLRRVEEDLDAHYELVEDVDANATNFEPIGSENRSFTGQFDGNGHAIRNLSMDYHEGDRYGLFAGVGEDGVVEGVALEDVAIEAGSSDRSLRATGGVAGYNAGTVRNASVEGSVSHAHDAEDLSNHKPIGGLVGDNDGTVARTYAHVVVRPEKGVGGGLVGRNDGEVRESYGAGTVITCGGGWGGCSYSGSAIPLGDRNGVADRVNWTDDAELVGVTGAEFDRSDRFRGSGARRNLTGFDFEDTWRETQEYPVFQWQYDGYALRGVGTERGPYEVADASDLRLIGERPDARFVLVDDVDASESAAWNDGAGFAPLGSAEAPFEGHLDGRGHEVVGLTIDRPGDDGVGLVGHLGADGTVEGVSLRNATITGGTAVGAAVGHNAGTVSHVGVSGTVDGDRHVGGVVGADEGTVATVRADAAVTGEERVGGVAGIESGSLTDARATGSVTGERTVGGLVGAVAGGTVSSAFAAATVEGADEAGGLAGARLGGSVDGAYWDETASGQSDSAAGIGRSTAEVTGAAENMTELGFASTPDRDGPWVTTAGYPRLGSFQSSTGLPGSGIAEDPYVVQTARDLSRIRSDPSAHYVLRSDVDATETASWNDGRAFEPIGDRDAPFTGTLDGDGHAIEGLTIDGPSVEDPDPAERYDLGLFAAVGSDGEVRDLHLRDVSVTATGEHYKSGTYDPPRVAVLAGTSHGTVRNVTVDGDSRVRSNVSAAGLVGWNEGRVAHSRSDATVVSDSSGVGLVDRNIGIVERSTANATIDADAGAGLVGRNDRLVRDSLATGSISSSGDAAGLVRTNAGSVERSLAAVRLEADGNAGGLIERNDDTGSSTGRVVDAYWDREASGVTDSDGGTGLATDALTGANATENLEGFETTWNATDGYPKPGN